MSKLEKAPDPLSNARSLNNRLIVENYKKEALRATQVNGFAFVDQKTALKGLKVLIDSSLPNGHFVRRGSIAYIKEETLHTQPWAQKSYECPAIEGKFLIVDVSHVEFIVPQE